MSVQCENMSRTELRGLAKVFESDGSIATVKMERSRMRLTHGINDVDMFVAQF